jgi:hypothetical protein
MNAPKKRGNWKGSKRGKYRPRNRRIGGDRPHTKLSREQVEAIWKHLQDNILTQTEIANLFGIVQENVSHIANGRRWCNVTGLPKRTKASSVPPPTGATNGRKRDGYKKLLKKASRKQYEALQNACIEAILSGTNKVEIKLPTLFKKPEGFPSFAEKIVIGGTNIVATMNAKTLLNWMYKNGHSPYSSQDMARMTAQVKMKISLADSYLGVDLFKDFVDNVGIDNIGEDDEQ